MSLNKIQTRNKERIESLIINILNNVVKYKAYDTDIKKCSFTYVELSSDKSYCKIYVDTFNRSEIDKLVKKLNNSKPVFKKYLAAELNMWKIPQINFEKDKTIDKVAKIDELFKKIHEEQKKN